MLVTPDQNNSIQYKETFNSARPLTRTVGLIAFGSPDNSVMREKSMRKNIIPLIKTYCTRTNPATKTNRIGLPSNAQAPMVFATPLRQINRDETIPANLDWKAKTIYAPTQAATNTTAGPL